MEIECFCGPIDDLATFMRYAWTSGQQKGRLVVDWTSEYLEWQLSPSATKGLHLLASYRNQQLVGFFGAEEMLFHTSDGPRTGSMGSWLTVHPSLRRTGLARLMQAAMWHRLGSRGVEFQIGFVNADSVGGSGRRTWSVLSSDAQEIPGLGLWCHILDPHNVARALSQSRPLRCVLAIGAMIQRQFLKRSIVHLRPFESRDLDCCYRLFLEKTLKSDFGILWTKERLEHQLDFRAFPQTLIYEENGGVTAFVNFHVLHLRGLETLRTAVIDFAVAPGLTNRRFAQVLRSAVFFIRATRKADLVVITGPGVHSTTTLTLAGFAPLPRESWAIYCPIAPGSKFAGGKNLMLFFR